MPISLDTDVDTFIQALRGAGTRRAYFTAANGGFAASHPLLEPMAKELASAPDFDAHEAVFLEVGAESGALLGAFLHKTVRGQGAGGVRNRRYAGTREVIADGQRLSRGMGRKNA